MYLNINFEKITLNIDILKHIFIGLCVYFIYLKITNQKFTFSKVNILLTFLSIVFSISVIYIRYKFNDLISFIYFIFIESIVCSQINKKNIGYNIVLFTISLGITYVLFFMGITITFIINLIFPIKNDFFNLIVLCNWNEHDGTGIGLGILTFLYISGYNKSFK